ncbi:MAG: hypothetical protein ABF242_04275 [Flavobacteriales bacterium]
MTTAEKTEDEKNLESKIQNHIGAASSIELKFQYQEMDKEVKLDLVTFNPTHNQSFLFHSVVGYSKVDSLNKMLEYLKNYKDKESSYTIQWSLKENSELNTSYFRAANLLAAIEKFYFERDINSIVVFSVVLNPIS